MDLTADQIEKLKSLGIETPQPPQENKNISPFPQGEMSRSDKGVSKKSVLPLLSISGLTLLSFGSMIMFKSKDTASVNPLPTTPPPEASNQQSITPTQVPKSIQHYLLASQQYFSQALQSQQSSTDQNQIATLLNQSIITATEAIKEFPDDYRGYQQRGKIYQALIDSQPQLLSQAITDFTLAQKYNPSSAEITHDLASLFAKKGDSQNTLAYLVKTVALEPTKAQNFYDLAKIQQQSGLIPDAIQTYTRLLPLITDPTQKTKVESEKTALENLMAQNPQSSQSISPSPTIDDLPSTISLPDNPPTIQALADNQGLIIAAPETSKNIEVQNQTDSNSLSGNATILANQKEVTITNSNISPSSQIYTAITNGDKDKILKVLSRSGTSFVVGFNEPIIQDTEFKWWIINK